MVAPRILWRYIFTDVGLHTLLGLAIFALVLVAGSVLGRLDEFVAVGVSPWVILQLTTIILPSYLVHAVPTALLFGVLISLGRMSADGEIVAMRSAGVSLYRIMPPIIVLGTLMTALGAYVTFDLEPRSHYRMKSVLKALLNTTSLVEPGRVRPVRNGQSIYVDELGDEACPLRGVFISDFSNPTRPFYVAARCGFVAEEGEDTASPGLALDMVDGSIHFAGEDDGSYRRLHFERGSTQLDLSQTLFQGKRLQHHSMGELLGPKIRERFPETSIQAEIHRRLALPAGSLVLGILAVPLGIRPVRSGRSAGAILAGGIMGLYWCVFTAGETVSESGWIPAWVALWLPNVIVLGLALYLTRRSTRGEV